MDKARELTYKIQEIRKKMGQILGITAYEGIENVYEHSYVFHLDNEKIQYFQALRNELFKLKEELVVEQSNRYNILVTETQKKPETSEARRPPELILPDPIPFAIQEGNNIISNTMIELVQAIYNEMIKEVNEMNSISLIPGNNDLFSPIRKLKMRDNVDTALYTIGSANLSITDEDKIELPCNEYINHEDFEIALNKYYRKNKGKIFKIVSKNKNYKMDVTTLKKCVNKLKECSTITLLKDNNNPNITKIYGSEQVKSYTNYIKDHQIGTISDSFRNGNYISKNEVIYTLTKLFKEKKDSWLNKALLKLEDVEPKQKTK